MADQISGGMGNLSIDSAPPAGQHPGQQPGARSYIPPHMRGKMGGAPPVNGPPMNGPPGPVPGAGPMNGLNNSAWAG
jgi:ATP-dependent RNA helicase DDX3X